jgi:putative ABC transport system permease protein
MPTLTQDLRYAARGFARNRGYTAVVVISIALGIAANTTVFSIVNGLLFGELPVRQPDRLLVFDGANSFSMPDYRDYARETKDVFEGVSAAMPIVPANVGGRGEPERVWGALASGNYFQVSGVRPILGRGFVPDEDRVLGRNPVVVLSYGLWRRRFGGDRGIVGREIAINGLNYTVVGVAPRGFSGTMRLVTPEFWIPTAMAPLAMADMLKASDFEKRDSHWLILNGRLKPGVSREQALAAVNVINQRLQQAYNKNLKGKPQPITLETAGGLPGRANGYVAGLMAVLMVVVGLVLLIACANVANLLLARATARQKEIGIRMAIGAGRGRLVRQLLTESLLLSLVAAAFAYALTWFAATALSRFTLPFPLPITFNFTPDMRVFTFAAALAILTGILFGLAPAVRATRPDLVAALKNTGGQFGTFRRFGMRNVLVVVQVSLSLVLLVGAGLFLRSLENATSIDLGFRPQNLLFMTFDPKLNRYSPEKTRQLLAQLRERVTALPGVESVSFLDSLPLSLGGTDDAFSEAGNKTGAKPISMDVYNVGTEFFTTMGMRLLRGRDFAMQPGDAGAVILNQTAAKNVFGSRDPIGGSLAGADHKIYRVIGVAGDSKSRTIGEKPAASAYLFMELNPERVMSIYGISILVKSSGNPATLFHPVREQILRLDPDLAVYNEHTMQQHVDSALLIPKVCAGLLGIFGAIGLVLAAVGLYGVMSYSVRSRTREIGIRMALGADSASVLRMVTSQGVGLTLVGSAIGLAVAFALSRFTSSFLYGIRPTDAITFTGVTAMLIVVAAVAVLVPARRAARVEPIAALHYE